jgi:hypothetical protein
MLIFMRSRRPCRLDPVLAPILLWGWCWPARTAAVRAGEAPTVASTTTLVSGRLAGGRSSYNDALSRRLYMRGPVEE